MTAEQLSGVSPQELAAELVGRFRREPPRLGTTELARRCVNGGVKRPVTDSMSVGTHRFYFATQVFGDMEALQNWPDEATTPLTPVDELGPGSRSSPEMPADAVRRHLTGLRDKQWFLHDRGEVGGPMALFTFVDITEEELMATAIGQLDLKGVVNAERRHIEPIVDAIAAQMEAFYLPLLDEVIDLIEYRSRWHQQFAAAVRTLTWPEQWTYPDPMLEMAGADGTPTQNGSGSSSGTQAADSEGDTQAALELPRMRLSKASFDDVVRTIRVWANAVERYPDAFGRLEEERLSDLLCATLNAALPRAGREVYSRGGKTDLFVHADTIDDGAAPLRVFIAECKWWKGQKGAHDALTQLRGYLEIKDTATMLVFFSDRVDGDGVRATALQTMLDAGAVLTDESLRPSGLMCGGTQRRVS